MRYTSKGQMERRRSRRKPAEASTGHGRTRLLVWQGRRVSLVSRQEWPSMHRVYDCISFGDTATRRRIAGEDRQRKASHDPAEVVNARGQRMLYATPISVCRPNWEFEPLWSSENSGPRRTRAVTMRLRS